MERSRRARRMQQHHSRNRRVAPLNLVSLMDIFTILVFFLLVNSSDVEVLPSTRTISLPESVAEEKARETVVVMVTGSDILVQGHKVTSVEEALADYSPALEPLQTALEQQAARLLRKTGGGGAGPEVTIMGDREISYRLLKKVMLSCTLAKYGKVSLAVMQKPTEGA
ncbi:MAG TPA: biopolymer transporter ExbD [Gammaproteobacteria bacterium]|nr:biopolymer transporter ExbD [Gammaproteobacteria bacterium]